MRQGCNYCNTLCAPGAAAIPSVARRAPKCVPNADRTRAPPSRRRPRGARGARGARPRRRSRCGAADRRGPGPWGTGENTAGAIASQPGGGETGGNRLDAQPPPGAQKYRRHATRTEPTLETQATKASKTMTTQRFRGPNLALQTRRGTPHLRAGPHRRRCSAPGRGRRRARRRRRPAPRSPRRTRRQRTPPPGGRGGSGPRLRRTPAARPTRLVRSNTPPQEWRRPPARTIVQTQCASKSTF